MRTASPRKEGETLDTFYHGRILVRQKSKGYRFSVDAPLLASFVQTRPGEELLDIGTGSGIISLLLSLRPSIRITALELQESLFRLARGNVALNKVKDKVRVVRGDLRTFRPGIKYDVIFSNPPYIKKFQGLPGPSREKAVAKHELESDICDILRATRRLLKKEGRAYFIFPWRRKLDFSQAVEDCGLKIRHLRLVYAREKEAARFFLAEVNFFSLKTEVLPPLVLYGQDGEYTPETQKIFAGGFSAQTARKHQRAH